MQFLVWSLWFEHHNSIFEMPDVPELDREGWEILQVSLQYFVDFVELLGSSEWKDNIDVRRPTVVSSVVEFADGLDLIHLVGNDDECSMEYLFELHLLHILLYLGSAINDLADAPRQSYRTL